MRPFCDPDQLKLRGQARQWVDESLPAVRKRGISLEQQAVELTRALGAEGFLKYAVPVAFGGAREKVQARDLCVLREELARGDALADTMFAMQALGSVPVTLAGSLAQKKHLLERVARGEWITAFALTEAEAGSDAASLRSRAERRGEAYCLNGAKRFISNAGIADSYVVFASTDPSKKARGISAFLLDGKRPGLAVQSIELLSPHPIGALQLNDCMLPQDALVGAEGQGLEIAFATLDLMRCTVGAAAVGLAQRALDEAVRYSQERRQFGRPIAEFQGIEFKLAEMATELEAARLLVYQAAWAHDSGQSDAKMKSSMAKLYATEAAQRVVDQALQIHGGSGLIAGSVMERLYRDVRALRIYEGTSEIQKIVIARELLRRA